MGWGVLAEEPHRWLVAGTVCRPWLADVVMTPISPAQFAAYSEPDQVKIIWTLEAESLGEARSRFATETRAAATDSEAKAKFRRYCRRFGVGMVMIRWLLLPRYGVRLGAVRERPLEPRATSAGRARRARVRVLRRYVAPGR